MKKIILTLIVMIISLQSKSQLSEEVKMSVNYIHGFGSFESKYMEGNATSKNYNGLDISFVLEMKNKWLGVGVFLKNVRAKKWNEDTSGLPKYEINELRFFSIGLESDIMFRKYMALYCRYGALFREETFSSDMRESHYDGGVLEVGLKGFLNINRDIGIISEIGYSKQTGIAVGLGMFLNLY